MKFKFNFLILFLLIIFASSCNNKNNTPQEKEKVVSFDLTEEDSEDYSYVLPSPLQIAYIFKKSGLIFYSELINDSKKAYTYTNKINIYLNFGIYSTDLYYCLINDQLQEAIEYSNSLVELSERLDLSGVINSNNIKTRFSNNINSKDSLTFIANTLKESIDEYYEEKKEKYYLPIFFTGAWVEGMYIGSNVLELESQKNNILLQTLLEQMAILDNLIIGLRTYPIAEDIDPIIKDLTEIKNIFNEFESIKGKNLDDISFKNIYISKHELKKLSSKIKELRTKITS